MIDLTFSWLVGFWNNTKGANLCTGHTFPGEWAHHPSCLPLFEQVLFHNQWVLLRRYHVLFGQLAFVGVVIKANPETLYNSIHHKLHKIPVWMLF